MHRRCNSTWMLSFWFSVFLVEHVSCMIHELDSSSLPWSVVCFHLYYFLFLFSESLSFSMWRKSIHTLSCVHSTNCSVRTFGLNDKSVWVLLFFSDFHASHVLWQSLVSVISLVSSSFRVFRIRVPSSLVYILVTLLLWQQTWKRDMGMRVMRVTDCLERPKRRGWILLRLRLSCNVLCHTVSLINSSMYFAFFYPSLLLNVFDGDLEESLPFHAGLLDLSS